MKQLTFREMFPELNDNQIKAFKRYMLELIGEDNEVTPNNYGMSLFDQVSNYERRRLRQKIEDL